MKRRDFLKSLGVGGAAVAVAPKALSDEVVKDPPVKSLSARTTSPDPDGVEWSSWATPNESWATNNTYTDGVEITRGGKVFVGKRMAPSRLPVR